MSSRDTVKNIQHELYFITGMYKNILFFFLWKLVFVSRVFLRHDDVVWYLACCSWYTSVIRAASAAAADDDYDGDNEYHNDEEEQEAAAAAAAAAAAVMRPSEREDDAAVDDEWHGAGEVYGSSHAGRAKKHPVAAAAAAQSTSVKYHGIECVINNEYSVSCRQDANGEVYLPFRFIRKYFEVHITTAVLTRARAISSFQFAFSGRVL